MYLTGVNQDLTFEPYKQFHYILLSNPVGGDIGNSLRTEAFTIGVIHHLLHCLSIAGHHPSRCREKVIMLIRLSIILVLYIILGFHHIFIISFENQVQFANDVKSILALKSSCWLFSNRL